ncbi:protein-L-isoaspartate O-methyltransferase family protein [Psychromonas ingrahamii]|uniref:protein-L-isoaspartate O-methyltransferase family protein n=1 Tax=Psychromonas ingrahamii TaxID=357794 RepID=UPI0009FB98B8|nr:hypothetical protein [Psychromonas ingrahamii]
MVRDQIKRRGISSINVLNAMRSVPRHLYVPQKFLNEAYSDYPLPIGLNQTISQLYIVAGQICCHNGKSCKEQRFDPTLRTFPPPIKLILNHPGWLIKSRNKPANAINKHLH